MQPCAIAHGALKFCVLDDDTEQDVCLGFIHSRCSLHHVCLLIVLFIADQECTYDACSDQRCGVDTKGVLFALLKHSIVPYCFRLHLIVTVHHFSPCRQLSALHGVRLTNKCGDCVPEGVMRSAGPELATALSGRSAQWLTPTLAGARRTWLRQTHHPAARPPAVSRPEQAQHPDASGSHIVHAHAVYTPTTMVCQYVVAAITAQQTTPTVGSCSSSHPNQALKAKAYNGSTTLAAHWQTRPTRSVLPLRSRNSRASSFSNRAACSHRLSKPPSMRQAQYDSHFTNA